MTSREKNVRWALLVAACLGGSALYRQQGFAPANPSSPTRSLNTQGAQQRESLRGERADLAELDHSSAQERSLTARPAAPESGARAELPRGFGTSTPEEFLFHATELLAEPFAPSDLDRLEETLPKLRSLADQIKAAALLHRHGRARGTEFLRDQLRQNGSAPASFPIAATLAMARDEPSLPMLINGLTGYARDPEFARAAAAWGHPALMEKARAAFDDPGAPRGLLAMMLAASGDRSVVGHLQELASRTPPQNPYNFTYRAALVRLGLAPAENLLSEIADVAANPARVLGFLSDTATLLGPERGAPFLILLLKDYSGRRRTYGQEYDEHAAGVHAGTRRINQMPAYPMMEERRMLEAISILQQWKTPDAADPIYSALEASQSGRYSVLLNRKLMAGALDVDPSRGAEQLRSLGFPTEEIDAARELTKLAPVAHTFRAQQKSIALTKPTKPEPVN